MLIANTPKGKRLKIFHTPNILVARNGYAGTMTYVASGEYTTNDHAYVLTVRKEWKDKINLEWFKYEYQELFFRIVTSKSDNATFNKEYAEKQIIRIPHIDYQNSMVAKLNEVNTLLAEVSSTSKRVEQLIECAFAV